MAIAASNESIFLKRNHSGNAKHKKCDDAYWEKRPERQTHKRKGWKQNEREKAEKYGAYSGEESDKAKNRVHNETAKYARGIFIGMFFYPVPRRKKCFPQNAYGEKIPEEPRKIPV